MNKIEDATLTAGAFQLPDEMLRLRFSVKKDGVPHSLSFVFYKHMTPLEIVHYMTEAAFAIWRSIEDE